MAVIKVLIVFVIQAFVNQFIHMQFVYMLSGQQRKDHLHDDFKNELHETAVSECKNYDIESGRETILDCNLMESTTIHGYFWTTDMNH